jgi:hypothetical protein
VGVWPFDRFEEEDDDKKSNHSFEAFELFLNDFSLSFLAVLIHLLPSLVPSLLQLVDW